MSFNNWNTDNLKKAAGGLLLIWFVLVFRFFINYCFLVIGVYMAAQGGLQILTKQEYYFSGWREGLMGRYVKESKSENQAILDGVFIIGLGIICLFISSIADTKTVANLTMSGLTIILAVIKFFIPPVG